MNHESWLLTHPTSNNDSQLLNHSTEPPFILYFPVSSQQWSNEAMNHDSWILNHPTSNPAEDAHTIALINPWKFHSDWSSHVRAYREDRAGFPLSPHTPLYTYASCAGWIKCTPSFLVLAGMSRTSSFQLEYSMWFVRLVLCGLGHRTHV